MGHKLALVGFGEAAQVFTAAGDWAQQATAFDILSDDPQRRAAKLDDYRTHGVTGSMSLEGALADATLVLSLVTADQALTAAENAARYIKPGALYYDMNSVAPETKRAAAQHIERAGGQYLDAAILAPVDPARLRVPILLSGIAAQSGRDKLEALGFTNVRVAGADIGRASAIKMVRSIIIKGLEALTAEWIIAAEAAGVRDEVLASVNESWPGIDWAAKADYNLDRMMTHGLRRAAEMEEVLKMLTSLGAGSDMTAATIRAQRAIGARGVAPRKGLMEKLNQLLDAENERP